MSTLGNNLNLGIMNSEMSCEIVLSYVSFAASVALEWLSHSSVRHHVALQITRRSTSVVTLVTLVWLFPCVLPHYVNFHLTSFNAGILTHSASVGLFPRVGPFVNVQSA